LNPIHGLSQRVIDQINDVLLRFPNVQQAILFGSRAKGSHRPGSDIDLALVGSGLNWRLVGGIYDALDDLLLPYRFSIIIYDERTDPEVAAHIRRVGIALFLRSPDGENALNAVDSVQTPKAQ
jgi:predicted nucleotidyltransferase